jgi:hypothetical protein
VVKIAIVVVLPIWIIWKLFSWIFGRRKSTGDQTPPE